MREFIWKENGKFFWAISDLIGRIVDKKEITLQEYLDYKKG